MPSSLGRASRLLEAGASYLSAGWRRLRPDAATWREVQGLVTSGTSGWSRARQRRHAHRGLIEYVAADLVNNCNLRCPFCLVDYDQVRHTELMDETTFRALLRLAPAVSEAGFWLSCLHEPTLHPRLGEYLTWIPPAHRRKFWFTTNLARPLPDSLLDAFARSGLHHINISLDTFNDELFALLRKHGRLAVFRDNLDRLVARFRQTPQAPPLRYITMAFRSNLDEIPLLVTWMNESGLAWETEIRYTYNTSNIPGEFRRDHFLRPADWETLRASLNRLPYRNYVIVEPPPDYSTDDLALPANSFVGLRVPSVPPTRLPRPLKLRARPDGRLHLSGQEDLFAVNIRDLADPVRHLADLCLP